jgi:hypothetical protein
VTNYPPYQPTTVYQPTPAVKVQAPAPANVAPVKVPPMKTVQPKPNAKPPVKKLVSKTNKPAAKRIPQLGNGQRKLASQLVKANAQNKLKELQSLLGNAIDNPVLNEVVSSVSNALAGGTSLSPNWAGKSAASLKSAGILSDIAGVVENLTVLASLVDANRVLCDDDDSCAGYVLPCGMTEVVCMPGLPEGETCLLPNGCVLVGAGDTGEYSVMEADAAELLGFPVAAGEPVPESALSGSQSGTLLLNPASNGVAVNYTINDSAYEIQPGFAQPLDETNTWTIRFDRGEGQGMAEYTLAPGAYAFGADMDGAWELFAQKYEVEIDNRSNGNAFNCVVDNRPQEIGAGQKQVVQSKYPVQIRFDRGNGQESSKAVQAKQASLTVAVNPRDGYWDLFPAESRVEAQAASSADAFETAAASQDDALTLRIKKLLRKASKS